MTNCLECNQPVFFPNKKFCQKKCRLKYHSKKYGQNHHDRRLQIYAKYRKEHREEINTKRKDRYYKNADKERTKRKEYYYAHQEEEQQKIRKYYREIGKEKNRQKREQRPFIIKTCLNCKKLFPTQQNIKHCSPQCCKTYSTKLTYWRNPEKSRQRTKLYRKSHAKKILVDKRKHYLQKRTRILLGATFLDEKDVDYIKQRDNYSCEYCGKMLHDKKYRELSDNIIHFDHIIPLDSFGPDNLQNVIVACPSCNGSKTSKNVYDWCRMKQKEVPLKVQVMLCLQLINTGFVFLEEAYSKTNY